MTQFRNPHDRDIFRDAPPLTLHGRTLTAHVAETTQASRHKRRWGRVAAACGFSFATGAVFVLILMWSIAP